MKTVIYSLLIATFLMLSSCTQNEAQKTVADSKKVMDFFYKPSFNGNENPENKIIHHNIEIQQNEIQYVKDYILPSLLNLSFDKIEGVAIYYNNPSLSIPVTIQNTNILALTVYEIDAAGDMRHSFFIKNERGGFTKEFSLLENLMSTLNQNFIVYKYFPEFYKRKSFGISSMRNVDFDHEMIYKQRNEFAMKRVTDTYKNVKLQEQFMQRVGEWDFGFTEDADCLSNCQEGGIGECDMGLYCKISFGNEDEDDEEDGPCDFKEQKVHAIENGVESTTADAIFNLALHRNLRDNFMKNYVIGEKYISYFYAVSGFLRKNDYDLNTLYKIISTLPEFNNSIQKLLDASYSGNDIIITPELKADILQITTNMKTFSDNADYQYVLSDIENDLEIISNKDKQTLISAIH